MSIRLKRILYVICLTLFICITYAFGRYIFSIISPEIVRDLQLDYEFVGRINALHQLMFLSFTFLGALISNKIGARRLVNISVVLCAVTVLSLAFVENKWLLMAIVSIQGIFAVTSWIPMVEMVQRTIPVEMRGKSLGLIACGTSYGVILCGILIPELITSYGLHSVWLVFGSIGLILGAAGVTYIANVENSLILASDSEASEKQSVTTSPKISVIQKLLLVFLLVFSGLCLIPYQSYISAYIVDDLKLGNSVNGLAWSILGGVGIFSGVVAGFVADKLSAKKAMIIVYTISGLSMLTACLANGQALILISCFLFACAYNGVFGLHPTYVSNIFPAKMATKWFGILNLSLGIGSMAGNYLSGYIKDIAGSFVYAYAFMAVMAAFTVGMSLFLRNDK